MSRFGVAALVHLPLLVLGPQLIWICIGPTHPVTVSRDSHVHQSCVWKTQCPQCHPSSLALLLSVSSSKSLPVWVLQSLSLSAHCSVIGLHVSSHLLQEEASLVMTTRGLIYEYSRVSLEVILFLHLLGTTVLIKTDSYFSLFWVLGAQDEGITGLLFVASMALFILVASRGNKCYVLKWLT